MNEIKFRAYIGSLGKMYDVISLHVKHPDEDFQRVFVNKPVEEGEVKNYRIDGEENFLMQYTGLKDKNDKEIYEGDVLRWTDDLGNEITGYIVYEPLFGEYSIDTWKEEETESDGYSFVDLLDIEYEVIGDIFQNTNLIK